MDTTRKVRLTRTLTVLALVAGLAVGVYGVFFGGNLPWLIASIAGWACVIWVIVVFFRQRSAAPTWRPADDNRRP